jgi:hypothetical protein
MKSDPDEDGASDFDPEAELELFVDHFDGVTRCGTGYKALCPAHDDRNPSLSIGLRDDERGVVLHCFGGCTPSTQTFGPDPVLGH